MMMTRRETEEFADAGGLLIRDCYEDRNIDSSTLRLSRVVERIQDAAFKRGYDQRQAELVENLRGAARDLNV
jgi:hypothetical protein